MWDLRCTMRSFVAVHKLSAVAHGLSNCGVWTLEYAGSVAVGLVTLWPVGS